MRGQFTPQACAGGARRVVRAPSARAHPSLHDRRLRREIEPVAPRDFLRFLFEWQRVAPAPASAGPSRSRRARAARGLRGAGRRVGNGTAAGAHRRLRSALARRAVHSRADAVDTPAAALGRCRERGTRAGSLRATPIVLLPRRELPLWTRARRRRAGDDRIGSRAQRVADHLAEHGASFFDDIARRHAPAADRDRGRAGRARRPWHRQLRQLRRPARAAGAGSKRARPGAPPRRVAAVRNRGCRALVAGPAAARRRRAGGVRRNRARRCIAIAIGRGRERHGRARRAHPAAPPRRRLLAAARARGRVAAAVARAAAASTAGSRRAARSAAAASSRDSPASSSRCRTRSALLRQVRRRPYDARARLRRGADPPNLRRHPSARRRGSRVSPARGSSIATASRSRRASAAMSPGCPTRTQMSGQPFAACSTAVRFRGSMQARCSTYRASNRRRQAEAGERGVSSRPSWFDPRWRVTAGLTATQRLLRRAPVGRRRSR